MIHILLEDTKNLLLSKPKEIDVILTNTHGEIQYYKTKSTPTFNQNIKSTPYKNV